VVYRHGGGEGAADSLGFIVSDGSADSSVAVLSFNILPINDAPTLTTVVTPVDVTEGSTYTLTASDVIAADVDSANTSFVYRLNALSTLSSIEVRGTTITTSDSFTHAQLVAGQVVYRHGGGEGAADSLGFIVSDGSADSSVAVLSFNILPVNDAPTLDISVISVPENNPGAEAATVVSADEDIGEILTVEVDDPRFEIQEGVLSLLTDQSLDFETEPLVELTVSVTDSFGSQIEELISIPVLDVNDQPEPVDQPVAQAGDGYQVPEGLFIDADNDVLSYSATLDNGDALPDWLEFDPVDRVFNVLDPTAVSLELPITIVAEDGRNGQASVSMLLQFEPPLAAAEPVEVIQSVDLQIALPPETVPVFTAAPVTSINSSENALSKESNTTAAAAEELTAEEEAVDLQALIKPLPIFGSLELAELDNNSKRKDGDSGTGSFGVDIDSLDLADFMRLSQSEISQNTEDFIASLDKQQANLDEQASFAQTIVGSSVGISSGLSVGYLIWLIRGGTLMGSVLSSMPAWRFVDPLPILGSLVEDIDGDDESLASMVDADGDDIETSSEEPYAKDKAHTGPFPGANS
ncbi:MAG: cadherin-like domain-containing protein, partial [Granulosicoccus sp.]